MGSRRGVARIVRSLKGGIRDREVGRIGQARNIDESACIHLDAVRGISLSAAAEKPREDELIRGRRLVGSSSLTNAVEGTVNPSMSIPLELFFV